VSRRSGNGQYDPREHGKSRRPPEFDDDEAAVTVPEDMSRRLRDVEREVDRLPAEMRAQSARIGGKIDLLAVKFDAGFATVATREWVMSKALWVYSLVVALLFVVAMMLLNFALSSAPAQPVSRAGDRDPVPVPSEISPVAPEESANPPVTP